LPPMSPDEFARLLEHFADRPLPATAARHVYLWHADISQLQAMLPGNLAVALDLHALAGDLRKQPYAVDEARRLLQAAIRRWLDNRPTGATNQQISVVTGVTLLVRYRVPLTDFFQAAGDSHMVVFVLPPLAVSFHPSRPLPAYLQFRPEANLEYFQTVLGPTSIVGATGK
jgi:hypothetical protein